MNEFSFLISFFWEFFGGSILIVQTPITIEGFRKLSSYPVGEFIKDSCLNPSKDILYVATYYTGVIVLSIQNISSIIKFSELYRFTTSGSPLFIRSLDQTHISVVSNLTNGQIIEVYEVMNSSADLTGSSDVLNGSDIRDLIISKDSNYIYGVDYVYSLFIFDVTNRSNVEWVYKCNRSTLNLHSTNLVQSNNGTVVYYFILYPDPPDAVYNRKAGIQMVNVSNPRNLTFYDYILHYDMFNVPINAMMMSETDFGMVAVCERNYDLYYIWDYDLYENMEDNFYTEGVSFCQPQTTQKMVIWKGNDYFLSVEKRTQVNLNIIKYGLNWNHVTFSWSPSFTNIHVLSETYIIQEDGNSGTFYSLGLTNFKPPLTIIDTTMYLSNYSPKLNISNISIQIMDTLTGQPLK